MPRGLTIAEAAAYAGCKSVAAYRDRVRRGVLPGPIPGTHSYDRRAIDAALDRLSGLAPQSGESSAYADWKKDHAGAP